MGWDEVRWGGAGCGEGIPRHYYNNRVGAHSSLSYPAVVQSRDLAEPCISAHLSLQAVIVMYCPGNAPALTQCSG